jgi:hypothetical protein
LGQKSRRRRKKNIRQRVIRVERQLKKEEGEELVCPVVGLVSAIFGTK